MSPPQHKKDEFDLARYRIRLSAAINTVPIYRLTAITKISRNTLTKYKHLQSSPDMRKLCLIAEATNISVHWILFGNGNNARS
ncbi:hypothetical protein VIS19158_11803 [Vibrio scophthalmi LMG 19158]|uniref:HTH cro/C1-type domain-containing protein n=1 Tax=Vibrio scophthalmi LMG 19158 TaxID=870967 RepID=F9RIE8_9VIBR|nr:hypothetical protein VIS19158_11803 [Vibrio scophthalmi LMG 19158]